MTLFREEALDYRNRPVVGNVIVRREPSSWLVLAVVIFLFCALSILVSEAHLNRKVTAQGILAPVSGAASIQAGRAGTIEKIFVREGQFIEANQPIAYIRYEQFLQSGEMVSSRSKEDLFASKASLEHQLSLSNSKISSMSIQTRQTIEGLRNRLNGLIEIRDAQRRRVDLTSSDLEAVRGLSARGFVSATDMRRQEAEEVAQRQAALEIEQRIVEVRTQISQQSQSLEQAIIDANSLRDDIARQRTDIRSRLGDIDRERGELLVSPEAGIVSSLQADKGSLVSIDRPVAMVMPRGAIMEARLYVPSEAIGFVEKGQPVTLLFAAFPYQHYGVGHGIVTSVSSFALPPDRVAGPLRLEEATYKVSVRLIDGELKAYGKSLRLMPGMSLTAEIVQDRRSIIRWLFDPILAVRGRLL